MFIYFKNSKDEENYCIYLSPCINYKTQVYVTESLPHRKHKALLWYLSPVNTCITLNLTNKMKVDIASVSPK